MRNTRSAHGPPTTNAATWESNEECIYCNSDAFQAGYGPRKLVMCACCSDGGAHVLCHEQATGELFTEEDLEKPSFQWFCSDECASISRQLVQLQGVRRPVCEAANICVELVRYSHRNRGSAAAIETALQIFHSAFEPLEMEGGKELLTLVCQAYESPDDEALQPDLSSDEPPELYDFSNFRVLVLRKSGTIVCVATLRIFGATFAELPFVATRQGYRREGHLRSLMRILDEMLEELGVKWLVLPAVKEVLPMWTQTFGFRALSRSETVILAERVVMPDSDSAKLLCRLVGTSSAGEGKKESGSAPNSTVARAQQGEKTGGSAKRPRAETSFKLRKKLKGMGVRAKEKDEYEPSNDEAEEDDDDDEDNGGGDMGSDLECVEACPERHRPVPLRKALPFAASTVPGAKQAPHDAVSKSALFPSPPTLEAEPAPAAAPASNPPQPSSSTPQACATCASPGPQRWTALEGGGWECGVCARYRRAHDGAPRPERCIKKYKAMVAGRVQPKSAAPFPCPLAPPQAGRLQAEGSRSPPRPLASIGGSQLGKSRPPPRPPAPVRAAKKRGKKDPSEAATRLALLEMRRTRQSQLEKRSERRAAAMASALALSRAFQDMFAACMCQKTEDSPPEAPEMPLALPESHSVLPGARQEEQHVGSLIEALGLAGKEQEGAAGEADSKAAAEAGVKAAEE